MKKFHITVNGNAYEVDVEEVGAAAPVAAAPAAPAAAPAAPVAAPAPAAAGATTITCPMPGTIVDIKVAAGDVVAEGQVLVVFEAMKMENEIVAPCAGTVASVSVTKGESVDSGKVLLSLN
ncbi:MAG: biotin/lipoyl-binding protein [Clostridia bacterium]|nr:biotin/lipoyl-binding protein [Clostridia bacterium]